MTVIESGLTQRLADRARDWGVVVDNTLETASSLVAFGSCENHSVVLKIVKVPGDEWHAGDVLQAFDGCGIVRLLRSVPGAMLLERLRPGVSLVEMSTTGHDADATEVLCDIMEAMCPRATATGFPTVTEWGRAFGRYMASENRLLPLHLVERAHEMFDRLAQTQATPRLLHGDLQHSNVLFDNQRGWVAIDPKGVIGEREYEIGAILRNPVGEPDLFTSPAVIERRVGQFASRLNIDVDRTLAWGFAQAVLSAVWAIEDGEVAPPASSVRLAEVLLSMIP